jgi:hypothetical protein
MLFEINASPWSYDPQGSSQKVLLGSEHAVAAGAGEAERRAAAAAGFGGGVLASLVGVIAAVALPRARRRWRAQSAKRHPEQQPMVLKYSIAL